MFLFSLMFLLKVEAMTVMLVPGCHIPDIQNDRVNLALSLREQYDFNTTIWFLTGSGKEAIVHESEAQCMSKQFSPSMNIVLDELATNTAENFAALKRYFIINNITETEPVIIINTSEFHKERAERIFKYIFPITNPKWNLGKVACPYCWDDEKIHMKNAENDAKKALAKIFI
jgi:hypothetical protein